MKLSKWEKLQEVNYKNCLEISLGGGISPPGITIRTRLHNLNKI